MDGQVTGLDSEGRLRSPMWLRLRVQHGFASTEERDRFPRLDHEEDR